MGSGAENRNLLLIRRSHGFRLSVGHQAFAILSPRLVEIPEFLGPALHGPGLDAPLPTNSALTLLKGTDSSCRGGTCPGDEERSLTN
jgi:hypothetical protein